MPRVPIRCSVCSAEILRWPSEVNESNFCSHECRFGAVTQARLFWERVNKTGECWTFTSNANAGGYGQLNFGGKHFLAHRLSYELCVGPIPDGLDVLHSCDNPPCVNPAHLFVGTDADNTADKVSKGRQNRGERVWTAKMDEERVREIRALHGTPGWTLRKIGARFGLTGPAVLQIAKRRRWKHVA